MGRWFSDAGQTSLPLASLRPMLSELAKAYEPQAVEAKWYAAWIAGKCFEADPTSEKDGYSIVIPPPNVTGILHLGHVLNNALQDILARRARQNGKEVLWQIGRASCRERV